MYHIWNFFCPRTDGVAAAPTVAHAPERLHEEIAADYSDMIYAATRQEIEARRKAFIRKWRLKHRAVADSLAPRLARIIKTAR